MWEYFTLQKNLKSLYSQKDIKEINKISLLGHNIMMTVSCAEYKQKQHEFIKCIILELLVIGVMFAVPLQRCYDDTFCVWWLVEYLKYLNMKLNEFNTTLKGWNILCLLNLSFLYLFKLFLISVLLLAAVMFFMLWQWKKITFKLCNISDY